MLMARTSLAAALFLALALQPALAAEPAHVTYVLGGVMSGPYRLEGDLVTGDFSEARAPAGKFGDGTGLDARTMPVTRRWTVPPEKLAVLRPLAARVWRPGMAKLVTFITHRRADGIPEIRPVVCTPSIDALGGLILERGGRQRSFDFSLSCLSKDGDAFLNALFAAK